MLRVADVDLVRIRLHALLAAAAAPPGSPWPDRWSAPQDRGEAAP